MEAFGTWCRRSTPWPRSVQRYEGTVQTLGKACWRCLACRWRRSTPGTLYGPRWNYSSGCGRRPPGTRRYPPRRSPPAWVCTRGVVVAGSHRDEVPQFVVVGGDTTQGAMRLQALADPGTLLVSDTTLRLLHSTVCSTAYGLVHVPGHAEPLMTYTVQSLEAPTATRLWSPFVGRQRELAVFDDLLARVLAGQGRWWA